jgi:hypothetical protein
VHLRRLRYHPIAFGFYPPENRVIMFTERTCNDTALSGHGNFPDLLAKSFDSANSSA